MRLVKAAKASPHAIFYRLSTGYTPTKYKRNLINNLLHRAHQICSSFTLLHKEFNQISLVLEKNGYPKNFLNKHINRFM